MNLEGKIYKNKLGLEFKVLKLIKKIKTEKYYEIQFLETGSIKTAERRNILKGAVRDNYNKHIYGKACKGNICSSKPLINKIAFKRWYSMIERCYSQNSVSYKSYGAKGCFVNEEWLCFENYFNDIFKIKGFNLEKYITDEIQLDKDILVKGNKEYSFEKCIFISQQENKRNQPSKKKEFIAVGPDGNKFEFENQNDCARKFGLTARSIGKVLNNQLNHHKNWKFYYK